MTNVSNDTHEDLARLVLISRVDRNTKHAPNQRRLSAFLIMAAREAHVMGMREMADALLAIDAEACEAHAKRAAEANCSLPF